MLDQFRGTVALEILEKLFERYHASGRVSSFRYESWDRVSPDLRVSRQEFARIKDKVTAFEPRPLFDTASYLESLEEKVRALSSIEESQRILEKLKELFAQSGVSKEANESPQVQERYENRKALGEGRENPDSENDLDLNDALSGKDLEARKQALNTLVCEKRVDYLDTVLKLEKKNPDAFIKGCCLRLLPLAEPEQHEKIYPYLEDDEPRVIATAIEALESIGGARALARISTFANHVDNRVRANALKALHSLGKEERLALFEKMIDSKFSAYRDSAAYAICTLRNPDFVPLLERLLQDPSESVRTKANHGLSYLAFQGVEKAREVLGRFCDQENKNGVHN